MSKLIVIADPALHLLLGNSWIAQAILINAFSFKISLKALHIPFDCFNTRNINLQSILNALVGFPLALLPH